MLQRLLCKLNDNQAVNSCHTESRRGCSPRGDVGAASKAFPDSFF